MPSQKVYCLQGPGFSIAETGTHLQNIAIVSICTPSAWQARPQGSVPIAPLHIGCEQAIDQRGTKEEH